MSLPDLAGLLRALVAGDVDFVVVGGVAVAAHAYVRATEDLDIVPSPSHDNLDRLVNVLDVLVRMPSAIDIADLERLTRPPGE